MQRGDGGAVDDVFATLGNETRIRILLELWRRTRAEGLDRGTPVSFSELRDAVGAGDSGNFSYHLDRLVGHFVGRVEDGYVIRHPGTQVVQAIRTGSVTHRAEFGPVTVDRACYRCGSDVIVTYRDGRLRTRCPECAGALDICGEETGTITLLTLPPAGIADREPTGAVRAACIRYFTGIDSLVAGVCPGCAGRAETTVDYCRDHEVPAGELCGACRNEPVAAAESTCRNCGVHRVFPPVFAVRSHPTVAAALDGRGVNPAAPGYRCLAELLRWPAETDGDGVVYAVPAPDRERRVRVDATLSATVEP